MEWQADSVVYSQKYPVIREWLLVLKLEKTNLGPTYKDDVKTRFLQ